MVVSALAYSKSESDPYVSFVISGRVYRASEIGQHDSGVGHR